MMREAVLGCVTTGINNWIDNLFLVLLLFHALALNKKSKRILCFYFLVLTPVVAGISYIFETMEPIRGLLYWIIALLAITLIPALTVRKEILKYEICYILNFVCILIPSYAILGGSMLLLHTENLYFHVNKVSMLPGFFFCNVIYIILFYASYRLSKIVIKSCLKESKIQNIIAFCYLGFTHAIAISTYFQIYSEGRLYVQGLTSIFLSIAFASLGFFVFTLYQSKQINKENALIKRHREKEMEYYSQLEKNQLTIRKLRHDIMNYFQAVRQMSGDEERVRKLLDELENQVREKYFFIND